MGKTNMNVCANIIRVALYIRVSHEEQAKHGLSLDAQIKALKRYAHENGWKVVDVYADEGITARKSLSKRKEFQRLMADVKADKLDMIIFIKLDRWFRNVPDYYKTQEILDAHHVGWKATEEDYDTTTANGRLHLNIKLSIAQNESDQTSDRIKFVFANRVKEGFVVSGKKKMGYDIVNKRLVINEKEAEMLNTLFDFYSKNGSLRETQFHFNKKYGTHFCYATIKDWLSDPAYVGEYVNMKGEKIENFSPQIIPSDLFYAVQNIFDKNKKMYKKDAGEMPVTLFDGLIYCEKCGFKFSRKVERKKRKTLPLKLYIYYYCWRSQRPSGTTHVVHACENTNICPEDRVEEYLLNNFKQLAENYIMENTIVEELKPKNNVEMKQTANSLKSKIAKLQTLFIENLIDFEEYKKRYSELNEQLQNITDEIKNKKKEKPKDFSKIKNLLNQDIQSLYNSLDKEEKRRFWLNTIDKIYVRHGDIVKVAFL